MSDWNATEYSRLNRPHHIWAQTVLENLVFQGSEIVLDAGCGSGNLTTHIASLVPDGHVIAIDSSKSMIDEAKIQIDPWKSHITLLNADLLQIPVSECIDLIFSNATFHWIHDHNRLFGEMFRVLRPGGTISAEFGGGPNIKQIIHHYFELTNEPEFAYLNEKSLPWNFPSILETEMHLVGAGFEKIQVSLRETPAIFHDISSFSRFTENIILFPLLSNIPNKNDRTNFVKKLARKTLTSHMPLTVDYWRINVVARKPNIALLNK